MSQFTTEVSQMNTAAQHVQTVNQQVHSLLTSLKSEVSSVGSHWKGAAQVSFTELMARYDANATKLNQALQGISEQIQQAGTSYNTEDTTHEASFKSVGGSLNL